jgi:hypothetical protein
MLLDDDDIRSMIEAVGDNTTALYGVLPFSVVFNPEGQNQLVGDVVENTGPYAVASAAAVATLGLKGGNSGEQITINTKHYKVVSMAPDGSGGTILTLLAVA